MMGIYKITNTINRKVYIGKSIDIEERWRQERYKQPNLHFANAVKKYGIENFSFEVLEECSEEQLDDKEKFYIKEYNSTDENLGYNITSGGTGGAMPPDVIKRSLATKEKRNSFVRYWKGKEIPNEIKEKISNSLKKEKNNNYKKFGKNAANHREVVCLETGEIFGSVKQIAEKLDVSAQRIRNAILSNEIFRGFHWKYLNKRPKIKNEDTGEIFNSASEAAKKYGSKESLSVIHKVCKGKRKRAFGFTWSYYYDE